MPRRILIVPDKFKGSLTASAAAGAIARGWREARPDDVLSLLPMSDGGDGFGEVLASVLQMQPQPCPTQDAAGRPSDSLWWWNPTQSTALIESAKVIGLALLPPEQYHPFQLDTFGLGAVFDAASQRGCERCLIGIGGSATNDGGFGMARALGWSFLGSNGRPLNQWTQLIDLAEIVPPTRTSGLQIQVAVDVQNPLLGPRGASRIYGPQKGLRHEDMALAEACLGQLVTVVRRALGCHAEEQPGTGAAGGLGYGLRCFMNAELISGFRIFARESDLRGRIAASDLVITGEGAIDPSTLMGKGVGELGAVCRELGVPCIGLAGVVTAAASAPANPFSATFGIVPTLAHSVEAQREAGIWLARLAARVAANWTG